MHRGRIHLSSTILQEAVKRMKAVAFICSDRDGALVARSKVCLFDLLILVIVLFEVFPL